MRKPSPVTLEVWGYFVAGIVVGLLVIHVIRALP
jgi:hypothetical protein